MIYRKYIDKDFKPEKLGKIHTAKKIITEYVAQGYDLTLRQLYYQFVARDLIANTMREYKNLAKAVNDGRLAGLLPWDAIVDRTRNLQSNSHWSAPSDIMSSAAESFAVDKWAGQDFRVEVWIEKDALIGVISEVCVDLDVGYFSCRGYTSQSEMWEAGQRLLRYERKHDAETVIFHLGDHDPSGMDMSRDIQDRLHMFGSGVDVRRIALNMDQVDEFSPPPNPAKLTDVRAAEYVAEYGYESWELDALEPRMMSELIREKIEEVRDEELWDERVELQTDGRKRLACIADNWEEHQDLVDVNLEDEDDDEDDD